MHVYELPAINLDGTFVGGSDAAERIEANAERVLYNAVAARLSTGVPLEPLLRCGTPWREIDVAADDVGADLIVLPAHERHGVLQALLGGHVAERVIATAHKSVLTVRDVEATAG
jgi:nucleotide-binding universal stress UspA family protein